MLGADFDGVTQTMQDQPKRSGLAGLFEIHRADLLRFLAARSGDPDNAEDLLQDLWFKASAQPAGPIANGRAYLFRMANNLMLDNLRSKRRSMARDGNWLNQDGFASATVDDRPDMSLPADELFTQKQEAAILQNAIEALPPGARRALSLFRIEEHSQAEVARIMGISQSGVEKHLAVAMKYLRNAIADCGYFEDAASANGEKPSGYVRSLGQKL